MLKHFPVLKIIQTQLAQVAGMFVLWLLLTVGVGEVAAQYVQDWGMVEYIAVGAGLLLLFWWGVLSWRIRNRVILELQDLFVANQMIPFNFARLKGSMPWNVGFNLDKLIKASAHEYRSLIEKAKLSNQTLEKYVGTSVSEKAANKALNSELGGNCAGFTCCFPTCGDLPT